MSLEGVLIVDKPSGMTSHDVVDRVRKAARMKRVGHTGTLDPMATGVLPLCLGKATKIVQYLQAEDKEYRVEMQLGVVTDSQDVTGNVVETHPVDASIDQQRVEAVLREFTGDLDQVPPMISAKHHNGRRLYELARQGIEVERPAKQVKVWRMELEQMQGSRVRFHVHCSKGTYIRTLCHDMGRQLGCGATMSALCRTRCGAFSLEESVPLEVLQEPASVAERLFPMNRALAGFPAVVLSPKAAAGVLQGRPAGADQVKSWDREFESEALVRIQGADSRLLGIGRALMDSRALSRLSVRSPVVKPVKILVKTASVAALNKTTL